MGFAISRDNLKPKLFFVTSLLNSSNVNLPYGTATSFVNLGSDSERIRHTKRGNKK